MFSKVWFRLLTGLLFLGLAACSPFSAKTDPNKPVTVNVTANEFGYTSSRTTFTAGQPYHFVVTNKGQVAHEIMLVKPIEPGKMNMEEMDKMALAHIEADDLQPGATATIDYTFAKAAPTGNLEFSCHIPGHYEAGMKLPITVK